MVRFLILLGIYALEFIILQTNPMLFDYGILAILIFLYLVAIILFIISICIHSRGLGDGIIVSVCLFLICPIEQLISKVYRPMKVPDQLMTIQGCPHCYPKCEPGVARVCPVCHKAIAPDQALTARLFNKAVGKKHVHIIGCSNCHKPRAD